MVLSEYAIASGNFIQFAKTVVSKVRLSIQSFQVSGTSLKKSYQYDQYDFHIQVENNYSFLLMVDRGFAMRIAFACLEDLKNTFFNQFSEQTRDNAIAYGLNEQFSRVRHPLY